MLYESASGYALFERQEADEIEDQSHAIQQSIVQFTTFSRMVSYRAFQPFADAEDALSNCNDVSEGKETMIDSKTHKIEGVLNPTLRAFLENHFSRDLKKRATLGVIEEKLGSAIQEALGIKCEVTAARCSTQSVEKYSHFRTDQRHSFTFHEVYTR